MKHQSVTARMDRELGPVTLPKPGFKLARRPRRQRLHRGRSRTEGNMKMRMRRLKSEMKVIRDEQEEISEGQKEIKKKMEKVGAECAKLREETELMSRQSAQTKLRLRLMFQILEARKNCNMNNVFHLILSLRHLMLGKQNMM